jgi:small subunit ribosomal protein S9
MPTTAAGKTVVKKPPKLYSGARKTARATAAIFPGAGRVRVNGTPVEIWEPEPARLHLLGPVHVVGDLREKYDLDVKVAGGGFMG